MFFSWDSTVSFAATSGVDGCDTWVREYGGGGKDIVESGSIGLFYSQRNNLRFVVLGCFASVVSKDGEYKVVGEVLSCVIYASFLLMWFFFFLSSRRGS